MDLFYIRHHYQSIVRSTSFGGEIFAFILIVVFFGGSIGLVYDFLDGYKDEVNALIGLSENSYLPFLTAFLLADLILKIVFKRPFPKVHYYLPWINQPKEIAKQYLFTSLFGIVPLLFFITLLLFASKAREWIGIEYALTLFFWWLANHFFGLMTQFSNKRVKTISLIFILLVSVGLFWIPLSISAFILNPVNSIIALFSTCLGAYFLVKSSLEKRAFVEVTEKKNLFNSLPSLSFKNPVFQLEWALIARNKRTRSNILMGLLSVLVLPLVVDGDSRFELVLLVYFFVTGFFIVQHGIYSLGWEGSYFDFLQVNISAKKFIQTRYIFYAGTCTLGFVLSTIPVLLNGLDFPFLVMIFLYNIGVTIPIVLYRSTLQDSKIDLSENSFMNYSGMMTGPIFISSFLVMLLPIFIFSLANSLFDGNGAFALGAIGLLGLLLHSPIVSFISNKLGKRKYHLSQSFKS